MRVLRTAAFTLVLIGCMFIATSAASADGTTMSGSSFSMTSSSSGTSSFDTFSGAGDSEGSDDESDDNGGCGSSEGDSEDSSEGDSVGTDSVSTADSDDEGGARDCGLSIAKVGDLISHDGATENFTYTVTNSGKLPIAVDKTTGVTDDKCSPVAYSSGDDNSDSMLDPTETWTFTCSTTVHETDANAQGDIVNTATVNGTVTIPGEQDGDGSCSGTDSVATSSESSESESESESDDCDDESGCSATDSVATSSESSESESESDDCDDESGCQAQAAVTTSSSDEDSSESDDDDCPKTVEVTATTTWTTHLVHPAVTVAKSADKAAVHVGDTITYTITVTNTGDTPVDVTPSDSGCTGLDTTKFTLAVGDHKDLTCTHVAATGDGGSYRNEACAVGDAGTGGQTANTCGHTDTLILHPSLTVVKDAQESTIDVGGTIHYSITVTNTGDTALTVTPEDTGCDSFDSTPFSLEPTQTKSLSCTHVTSANDGASYTNTACATGADTLGGSTAKVCDPAATTVTTPTVTTNPPITPSSPSSNTVLGANDPGAQIVLGQRITPGSARLLGPSGCTARAFSARVRGTKIARVVFILDGKRVTTLTKPNSGKLFALRIDPAKLRLGVHRLVATVTFQKGTGTKAKNLRLSFQRCGRNLTAPRFTG